VGGRLQFFHDFWETELDTHPHLLQAVLGYAPLHIPTPPCHTRTQLLHALAREKQPPDRRRSERSTLEGGHFGSSIDSPSSKLHFQPLPGAQEIRWPKTCSKPEEAQERMVGHPILQDGHLGRRLSSHSTRRLGGNPRFEGCLSAHPYCHLSQEILTLQMARHPLAVQRPSFRPVTSPQSFHSVDQNNQGLPRQEGHLHDILPQPFPDSGPILQHMFGERFFRPLNAYQGGISHQLGEVKSQPFHPLPVPRDDVGLSPRVPEPSTRETIISPVTVSSPSQGKDAYLPSSPGYDGPHRGLPQDGSSSSPERQVTASQPKLRYFSELDFRKKVPLLPQAVKSLQWILQLQLHQCQGIFGTCRQNLAT
jgi:hypothetical protein